MPGIDSKPVNCAESMMLLALFVKRNAPRRLPRTSWRSWRLPYGKPRFASMAVDYIEVAPYSI